MAVLSVERKVLASEASSMENLHVFLFINDGASESGLNIGRSFSEGIFYLLRAGMTLWSGKKDKNRPSPQIDL